MKNLANKLIELTEYFRELGSIAIAFSGGVDSTFLLKVAHDTLGDNAIAVTINTAAIAKREINTGAEFCKAEGIRLEVVSIDEMQIDHFTENPSDRCYYCKKAIFEEILKLAKDNGINYVAEGSNVDDDTDYRPGHRALAELDIKSPLRQAGLTKADIRVLSKELGLPSWNKPSFACLASRIPYGEEITREKLAMVEMAEDYLLKNGFEQMRVRMHGKIARIEVLPEDIEKAVNMRVAIHDEFKTIGFDYVTLDLMGFRSGSMNEVLK